MLSTDAMKIKGKPPSSGGQGPQGRHAADVAGHRHQRPFAPHGRQTAQQELAEAHDAFDDTEHRLDGLLTQGIPATAGVTSGGGSLKRSGQGR